MAVLRTLAGPGPQEPVHLTAERSVVGRRPSSEVLIDSSAVSRQHAQILNHDGVYVLEDLRSRNGTYLNGIQVTDRQPLKDGDRIKICETVFEFRTSGMPSTIESLPHLLREQNVNFQGPSWEAVQRDLQTETSRLSRLLRAQFSHVIVLDTDDGVAGDGGFDMDLFLRRSWTKIAATFDLPDNEQSFHPQQISQALKSEPPALFCFLNIQRLSDDGVHQLRGLGFTQDDHHVLYVGQNPALRSMAFPLTRIDGDVREEARADEEDVVGIVSSSTLMRVEPVRKLTVEAKLQALQEIGPALFASGPDEQAISEAFLDLVFETLSIAVAGTVVLQSNDGTTRVSATRRRNLRGAEIPAPVSIVGRTLSTGRPALLKSPADWDDTRGVTLDEMRIGSVLSVPFQGLDGVCLGAAVISSSRSKTFQDEDLQLLTSLSSIAGIALWSARLLCLVNKAQDLDRELTLATQVQVDFLPVERPQVPGYEFCDHYQTANQVGGDYFCYVPRDNDRLAIVVADVAGRGIAAALVTAFLASAVRHSLLSPASPEQALQSINREIIQCGFGNRFVTLVIAEIDFRSHRLTIANAGQTIPLLRRSNGDVEAIGCEQVGLPLGITADAQYETVSMPFETGDVLLLFTDGITEAMDTSNQIFGEQRLMAALSAHAGNAEELLGSLVTSVESFAGQRNLRDDLCLIACRRTG